MTTSPLAAFEVEANSPHGTDLSSRLDELRLGRQMPVGGLDWLAVAFARWYPADLARPFLFATPECGLQATWALPPVAPSLHVDLATRTGRWHEVGRGGRTTTVDLSSPVDWSWIVDRLRQLRSDAARQPAIGC